MLMSYFGLLSAFGSKRCAFPLSLSDKLASKKAYPMQEFFFRRKGGQFDRQIGRDERGEEGSMGPLVTRRPGFFLEGCQHMLLSCVDLLVC